jgi:preprotein translocase subunit SecA
MQSLLANQDPQIQASLASRFTSDLAPYGQMIIFSLPDEIKNELVPIYGAKIQNEIYRQVLLGAISELWIDYLTRVEALRVSIGLEAYAQKDPLVTYKSKATELFQNLLTDIRLAVISRMFLLQPRRASTTPETREKNLPAPPPQTEAQAQITQPAREAQPQREGGEKKRKRHRH